MKAIIELERMGYQFKLNDGQLEYLATDENADRITSYFWLLRLGDNKAEAVEYIKINEVAKQFAATFDKWEQDPSPENESNYIQELSNIAIDGGLPCYEDGKNDAGPDAWQRWSDFYQRSTEEVQRTNKSEKRQLPWQTNN